MAKFIVLPDVSKIESVLDLITDPDKYAKMLSDLRESIVVANGRLDDLATKEQADLYLAQAHEKLTEAVRKEQQVSKDSAVILQNVAVAEAALKEKQEIFHQSAVKRGDAQDQEERTLLAAQAVFEHRLMGTEKLLIEREQSLLDGQAKLAEDTKIFLAKREKFQKALEG